MFKVIISFELGFMLAIWIAIFLVKYAYRKGWIINTGLAWKERNKK